MNKLATFLLGTVVGGGIGAAITAYLVRDRYEQITADIVDDYHEHCQSRIEAIMQAYGVRDEDLAKLEDAESQTDSSLNSSEGSQDPRDDYSNNEGVKKYHHYVAPTTDLKGMDDMTKGQEDVKKYPHIDDCPEYIDEITEDDFLVDEKEFDDVHMVYDFNVDRLLLNEGTEDEIDAEEQYHCSRSEIIGNMWKWSTDYISEDDGTGVFYARNRRMMKDFEVVVRYDPNQDVTEID